MALGCCEGIRGLVSAVSLALIANSAPSTLLAQPLPRATPEAEGLSSERLDRLTQVFQHAVDHGDVPGAVVAVARDGRLVYESAFGFQNREDKIPMKTSAIFRIASMSKPITTVAAMMLVEDGKLDIAAPVSRYLPEFKDLKVGQNGQPLQRPMMVQDLLRHTSGLIYPFFAEDKAIVQAYFGANIYDYSLSLAEMVAKFAKLPLAHQPGTTWDYSMSTDVLGRIIEVVSGQDLDRFVQQRIAEPLHLQATGFTVSPAQANDLAEPQIDPSTGKRPPMIVDPTSKLRWFSGGGGMVFTADDYLRFCQMLLNGGELDGVRLLSPRTVASMTTDQLPPGIGYNATVVGLLQEQAPTPEMGEGFGYGFLVRTQTGRNPLPGSVGDFSWDGAHGTYFWVAPKEKLAAVLMLQNPFDGEGRGISIHYRHEMRYMVYQAVIGPPAAEPPTIR
jgi:CubicO group peptidase (beta-lactamase class C family)